VDEKYQAYLCSREWGLKREAVAARSGGVCERCKRNPAYAVHHLTYARKYREPLSDLIHLCEECHDFNHGRSNHDPSKRVLPERKVYVAGPVVEEEGWGDDENDDDYTPYISWTVFTGWRGTIFKSQKHGAIPLGTACGRFIYNGPLFESWNHGSAEGTMHGENFYSHNGCDGDEDKLVRRCMAQVKDSDFLFAWVDRIDTVGTIVEITVAHACGVPIFLAHKSEYYFRHFYFINSLSAMCGVRPTAREAWQRFVQWCDEYDA
jgi:hypothetical protein